MKKIVLLIFLLFPSVMFANPTWLGVNISEIYFDGNGDWVLEINNYYEPAEYLDSIVIECSSGRAKIQFYDNVYYIVISNANLSTPLTFNKDNDCIKLISYSYTEFKTDSVDLGIHPGSYLKHIQPGQSVSRFYYYGGGPFFKTNKPTIGAENKLDGSIGKIYGYFYENDTNYKATNYDFFFNEGYSGTIHINANGYFTASLTSRNYYADFFTLYGPSQRYIDTYVKPVSFEINEKDSLNINFYRTLTAVQEIISTPVLICNYPNPACDYTYFIFDASESVISSNDYVTISIFNINGSLVETIRTNSKKTKWNCNKFGTGLYIYSLSLDDKLLKTGELVISR